MRFVDLFCGIGGFHAALDQLGHECIFAIDIDKHAAAVYEANWGKPGGFDVHCDIREVIDDIQKGRSTGLCFGWYRITITLPTAIAGQDLAGRSIFFETCVDDYGELWIDGECDMAVGETWHGCVSGFN